MDKKFKVLTTKEEQKLSIEELKKYYKELREYLLKRKLTNTTPGATTIAPKLKKITNKICEATIKAFTSKDVEKICEGLENIPDGPVIFAHTHQSILDGFVWIPQLDRHVIILFHNVANKFLILCQCNTGLVLVKKDDKENALNAKLDMMELLLKGHSISWFPEGTYCLSPNKFHLPHRFGFLDVAKKTGVPIIPVAHNFVYDFSGEKSKITKIQTKYGNPIYVSENDDLVTKLEEYEASISTLKYEMMEENGIYCRDEITNFEYINYLKEMYKAIELSKVDKEKEKTSIFRANEDFYKFHHLNDIPFTKDGSFIDPFEVRNLEKIIQEQNIKHINKLIENLRASEDFKRKQLLYRRKNQT